MSISSNNSMPRFENVNINKLYVPKAKVSNVDLGGGRTESTKSASISAQSNVMEAQKTSKKSSKPPQKEVFLKTTSNDPNIKKSATTKKTQLFKFSLNNLKSSKAAGKLPTVKGITRNPTSGNFEVKDKNSHTSTASRDILKALDQGMRDASINRSDIRTMCKALANDKSFSAEMEKSPELKEEFVKIQNACSEKAEKQVEKLGSQTLANLEKCILKTSEASVPILNESISILSLNSDIFSNLVHLSGMSDKELDINDEKVPI
ncbi:MAG: hypothetical protein H0U49_12890, partial [Parachlamydiaceae bacterium]|nr:hypothetical protein [Parachlamydiaceae bacterium]